MEQDKNKHIIIGVTMALDDYDMIRSGIDYSYIRREYGEMIRHAGGQPVFLEDSIDPELAAQLVDGVVISGGEDIEPSLYGQEDKSGLRKEPVRRTHWERCLIEACDQLSKPIFGVCYGSQLLNVHYGGSLYQDIGAEVGSAMAHGSSAAPARHAVTFSHRFMGFEFNDRVEVASRHHQAVKDLAPGFVAMARAADGVVEAISNGRHTGVQWHAESDETGEKLYRAFVDRCRRGKSARQRQVAASQLHRLPIH